MAVSQKIFMRLIFGIRTSQATKLVVSGGPASTGLPVLITTRDPLTETSVPCEQGSWTADLRQGDHIVRIEIPNENDWFDDKLYFSVNPGATIVSLWPQEASAPEINVWLALEGGSDPKDPWPPPLVAARVTLDDAQWLTDALRKIRMQIDVTRSG